MRRLFNYVLVAFLVILIVATWIGWFAIGPRLSLILPDILKAGAQNSGPIGDSFGPYSALFGALGFLAVITTLWIQYSGFREQQKDSYIQRFEGVFFNLIDLMRISRNEIRFRYSVPYRKSKGNNVSEIENGHLAFRSASFEVMNWLGYSNSYNNSASAAKIYSTRIHRRYESTFGPYYRMIYTILERIRKDEVLSEKQKFMFGNLLRSQLTTFETFMIGLNGLTKESKDMFDLIVYFRLLKYVPDGNKKRILGSYYPKEAFEGRD